MLEYPNPLVRSLKDLEEVQQLRLVIGGPAKNGENDPDGVGLVDWQLVIYSGKGGVNAALDFVHFVMQHKVMKGYLDSMPALQARVVEPAATVHTLPTPWSLLTGDSVAPPLPFCALPPKGRRHVLCQLDRQEDGGHMLTFFGGIYHFKDRFETHGIQGALLATGTAGERDYVRYVDCSVDEATSRQRATTVLESVLLGLPLYFINSAGSDDPMAAWLQLQPSIAQLESQSEATGSAPQALPHS